MIRARAIVARVRFQFDIELLVSPRGGFKSQACLLGFARFGGGFALRPSGEGCLVTHVERYELRPRILGLLLAPFWRWYIGRTIDREMSRLKEVLEMPAAA